MKTTTSTTTGDRNIIVHGRAGHFNINHTEPYALMTQVWGELNKEESMETTTSTTTTVERDIIVCGRAGHLI